MKRIARMNSTRKMYHKLILSMFCLFVKLVRYFFELIPFLLFVKLVCGVLLVVLGLRFLKKNFTKRFLRCIVCLDKT